MNAGVAANATLTFCRRPDELMDIFLLFAVIFLCVMFGLGLSALALSLLFKLILKISARASSMRPSWRGIGQRTCGRYSLAE